MLSVSVATKGTTVLEQRETRPDQEIRVGPMEVRYLEDTR